MNLTTRCLIFSPGMSTLRLGSRQPEWGDPCGGRVEYLHCDPASRRRRRKGKSQIWDSKIRLQVPRDKDPRKTALARASGTYKRQTHPLVREGAPRNQEHNCQTYSVFRAEIKIWSQAPDGCFIPRETGRLTVSRNKESDSDSARVSRE
jgi:hypothetical protein